MKRILIVEDDQLLNQTLTFNLISDGYAVRSAYSLAQAREAGGAFDLILLDVHLPDGNGTDFCRGLREEGNNVYILFLTADDRESDMLRGYEAGGSDYLTKPFSIAVLGRKIAAIFASLDHLPQRDQYDDGFLHLDFSAQSARLGGEALELTPREYKTLHLFVQNPGIILTKNQLLERLWDDEGNFVDEHTLTTTISRIRKKLERGGREYIRTRYGVGYQWTGGGKTMKKQRISVRSACILFLLGMEGTLMILTVVLTVAVRSWAVPAAGGLMMALTAGWGAAFLFYFQRRLERFAAGLCETADAMAMGRELPAPVEYREDLFSRIQHRMLRVYETLHETRGQAERDRGELQSLLSDISHQTKTPVSNLKMLCETLLVRELSPSEREEMLRAAESQLDKLEFWIQAMVKTSRMESGMIVLKKRDAPVLDTVVQSVNGVLAAVERKNLHLSIDCPERLRWRHDVRWTSEALFNLLDNAVKYTPDGGAVGIRVQEWENSLRIDVTDTGRGIPECEQAQIFRRFYRSPEVHETEGAGLGLYLARRILTMQGGSIQVRSDPGRGSDFIVYLPRRELFQNGED